MSLCCYFSHLHLSYHFETTGGESYTCLYSTYTWHSLPVNTHFKTVPSLNLQVPLISQNYPSFIVVINLAMIFFVCAARELFTWVIHSYLLWEQLLNNLKLCQNLDKLDGLHACSLWIYIYVISKNKYDSLSGGTSRLYIKRHPAWIELASLLLNWHLFGMFYWNEVMHNYKSIINKLYVNISG